LRSRGQIWGWVFATHSFPIAHDWARSLSRAVCFPTPLSAALRMFRSHGGTVLTVAGRDLLSEASAPSSVAPCRERHAGRGADTSAILLRVGTVTAGTAPAFGWSLALRYGSDLLPLRLLFAFAVWRRGLSRCPIEEVDEPCRTRSLRAVASPLRAFSTEVDRAFWRGRPAGKRGCVLVFTVAT
jgi:hypothetical protein